ncbi:uncharacterized protein LOC126293499 isoform X1 [Schistocerca gregaria]|uniref:uncharacterized protein LOC126293499 isoform X1 n=1 Tax=Schistocerca gregaria TaxID=7010 RepID=UPI00211DF079|nr:uncharacterized protein LOC126293499 isoform X1 [Schistocerca gregaria]
MDEEGEVRNSKKQTLLEKYDIPVEHLNFEYVEKCNDEKELEKIVKILRSGEEGFYPQLIASAEARLRKVKPDSRVLRTEEPALRKETTSSEQWEEVTSEVEKWSDEMRAKEKELKLAAAEPMDVSELPAVRSRAKVSASTKPASATTQSKTGQQVPPAKRSPVPRDYSAWEKYDADKELTLMEIEEQQQQEERERKRREEQLQVQRLQDEMKKAGKGNAEMVIPANLTPTERELLATREKDKGNDFFKVADYSNAIKHYSASIQILPTPVAYNNRAIAMIKLHRYDAALKDCNEVLKVEPDNVKALMRRGISHQNRNSYQKAYEDFNRVVALQPENGLAKSLANQMKNKCLAKRKGVRMKIEEEGSPSQISVVSKRRATKVTEQKLENLPSSERTWEGRQEPWQPPPLPDKILEAPWGGRMNPPLKEGCNTSWPYAPPVKGPMTDYGLPKNFCNCNGEPPFVRHPPQIICLMCHERKVLGLPPLPGGDCNCPKQPPQKKPVVNGGASGEGTAPAKDESNFDREKRGSETNVEEPKPTTSDDTGDRLAAAEPTGEAPQPAGSSTTGESGRRRQRNIPHPSASFLPQIPGLGSPVKMKVAPKYICATKREDKSAESSSEDSGTTTVRGTRENTPEAGPSAAQRDRDGDGLQKVAALGRLSLQPGARITSPYEFTRAWGGSRPDSSLEGYATVLRAVAVEDLATVVGTKLDGQMLSLILRTLEKHFIDEPEYLVQMLHHVALLPRFSIAWAFLDSIDKEAVDKIVSTLKKSGHELSPVAEKAFEL